MCLFHVKLDFIPLRRKIMTAIIIHSFDFTHQHPLIFFRALGFSDGHCSTQNNTILIFFSALKKTCFIYVFKLFLLFIHIETLDPYISSVNLINCIPECYDFILGITKHKEQRTEKFVLYAIISTRYKNL